jgi:EpsI family protein
VGWRFFDRNIDDPWFNPEALAVEPGRVSPTIIGISAILIATLPIGWSAVVSAAGTRPVPATLDLPQIPGWQQVPNEGGIAWQPHFAGADLFRMARYRDARGREVDLAIAVYARQSEGRELVGFGQGAVGPEGRWAWTANAAAPLDGRAERIASRRLVREVVSFYRVGGITTGSSLGVKLETMKTRLFGGPQRAVAVLASAPAPAEGDSPRPAIDDFLRALGPVAPLADRAAGFE